MPVLINKAQTINGVTVPAGFAIFGLDVDTEAKLKAGGAGSTVNLAVLGDTDAAAVKGLVSRYGKGRNVGTRIPHSRHGTFDDSAQGTFANWWEIPAEAVDVRLILMNLDPTKAAYFACAVSTAAVLGDGNNSSGTWITAGQGTDITTTVPNAIKVSSSAPRISYGFTNWVPLHTPQRTDGGWGYLVFARARNLIPSATLGVMGSGPSAPVDALTGWASRTTGRAFGRRWQAVDGVTTPANFTSTTNISQSPIVGIQYRVKGRVITVMGVGDSIKNGQGSLTSEGYLLPAADALSASLGVPVEYANCAIAGMNSGDVNGAGYIPRALDLLRAGVLPDILCTSIGTGNDVPVGPPANITTSIIDRQRYALGQLLAECGALGVNVLLDTWMPADYSIWQFGATDALREAYNAEMLAAYSGQAVKGVSIIDVATPMNGTRHASGQMQMGATVSTDRVHPNDTGNSILTPLATAGMATLLF